MGLYSITVSLEGDIAQALRAARSSRGLGFSSPYWARWAKCYCSSWSCLLPGVTADSELTWSMIVPSCFSLAIYFCHSKGVAPGV